VERKRVVKAAKITLRKPEGAKALKYLKEVRKLSDKVIDKFNIGYCPIDVDIWIRGRIITPIYDTYGEVVALSTRHLNRDVKQRFLHESFNKGMYLYGLSNAKHSIQKNNKVIIVEGECDVACLHSYGFDMAVGLCGSAFTLFQISLLSRYCDKYYLMLDGDQAGINSTKRAINDFQKYNLKAYKLNFIPVKLPHGTDPDDFLINNGREKMIEKLKKSKEDILF
jgi:DNA primase